MHVGACLCVWTVPDNVRKSFEKASPTAAHSTGVDKVGAQHVCYPTQLCCAQWNLFRGV